MVEQQEMIGALIHPDSGVRTPVLALLGGDQIRVRGTYMDFETHLRSAIRGGYTLESNNHDLLGAWDKQRQAAEAERFRIQQELQELANLHSEGLKK